MSFYKDSYGTCHHTCYLCQAQRHIDGAAKRACPSSTPYLSQFPLASISPAATRFLELLIKDQIRCHVILPRSVLSLKSISFRCYAFQYQVNLGPAVEGGDVGAVAVDGEEVGLVAS